MADDEIVAASREARLALLRHITTTVESYNTASNLKDLAYAYALVVGASASRLPGALVQVETK